ncbi:MAG TPA: LD-carboxypeptidase [Fimbriimonas sp.]|nr:LD-carboxypeptidase [Fimbriimonas sp.]
MPKPKALIPGNTIGIVSPSSAVTPEQTERCFSLLRGQGYKLKIFPNVYNRHGFLAGTDDERVHDLHAAFADPEVDAVFCSRGGYGAGRLIDQLDWEMMAASGKMFLGFSDITVLHAGLNRRGLPTVHAPMALTLSFDRPDWVIESFLKVLKGDLKVPEHAATGTCLNPGIAEGVVTGGCLILLCDLIGTKEEVDFTDKLVLIEDVDESPHRVDAMLTHLINTKALEKASGLIIGEMTRTDEKADKSIGELNWVEIVKERLGPLGLPTMLHFPFGHAKAMLSLPMGIRARMDANNGTLSYTESLCN